MCTCPCVCTFWGVGEGPAQDRMVLPESGSSLGRGCCRSLLSPAAPALAPLEPDYGSGRGAVLGGWSNKQRQVPAEGCVRSSLWPGYPPAQGRRGRPAFSGQGATTACSRELPCNFCMQCEISRFYFHSMACIGVILPREADGSGMLLVHPGFSGELAVPWLQPVCPGLAPGEKVQGRGDGSPSSLGFFVPAVQGDPELPWGSDLRFPRSHCWLSGRQLCSQTSFVRFCLTLWRK